MGFDEAVSYTAQQIVSLGRPLFLGLSGGLDSVFVLRALHARNIQVTPIIVMLIGTMEENLWAFDACRRLGISPQVYGLTDHQHFAVYKRGIVERFGCYGMNGVPKMVAAMKANQQGGIFLNGEHFIADSRPNADLLDANAWDNYEESEADVVPFFNYTPELAYAIAARMDGSPMADFKANLFGVKKRPKLLPKHPPTIMKRMLSITKVNYEATYVIGTPAEFMSMMERWNEGVVDSASAGGGVTG